MSLLSILFNYGANPNVQIPTYHLRASLLIYAVQKNKLERVKAPMSQGADLNLKDSLKNTAMQYAKRRGYKEIEEVLQD